MLSSIKAVCREARFFTRDFVYNRKSRQRPINPDFSIIGSDCIAGCIYKDLRVRMNSSTRNFYFNAGECIKFCQNLPYYLSLPLSKDTKQLDTEYLTAMCGDIRLFLVYYESINAAQEQWERRRARVNFDNLFFLMNDRTFTQRIISKHLTNCLMKTKYALHIKGIRIKIHFFIPGSEDKECVETITKYIHPWGIKRYYDYFDFVCWLNQGKI